MVDSLLLDEQKTQSALDSVREVALALPVEALKPQINLNALLATTIALGAIPRILTVRERATQLPAFDVSCFDQLETLTLAFFQAHAAARAAIAPVEELPELAERGIKRRRELLDDIKPLSNRGLLDQAQLARLGGGTAYREIALDLQIIVTVLQQAWPQIHQSTPITPDDIREAEALGQSLLFGVSRREVGGPEVEKARDLELRVFTLFANAYRQVERAVDFLCWNEDPDKIAPTIYGGGNGRPPKEQTATKEAEEAEEAECEAPPKATSAAEPVPPTGDPNSPPFEPS